MKAGDLVIVARGDQMPFYPQILGVMLRRVPCYDPRKAPLVLVFIKGRQRYFEYSSLDIVSKNRSQPTRTCGAANLKE